MGMLDHSNLVVTRGKQVLKKDNGRAIFYSVSGS